MISTEQIKSLREKTGFSVIECKNTLEQAKGNEIEAMEILGIKGQEAAQKKKERETKEGLIETYVHNNGKIGAILELNCETDFVARNPEFKELAHNLTMHLAAMKPENLDEFLSQPFIRDQEKTIKDLINEAIAKLGENIKIGEFAIIKI